MSELTFRVEQTGDEIVAYIEEGGYPVLVQPHHPNQILIDGKGTWSNMQEAEDWARTFIEHRKEQDALAVQRQVAQEAHAENVAKLVQLLSDTDLTTALTALAKQQA